MARPRSLSDDEVLGRIAAALGGIGTTWTLNGAAEAAGLHPATLIKRFGSRHGLLLALSRRWIETIPAAATTNDALRELHHWATSLSEREASPAQLLARADMLLEDLRDPELRSLLHQGWTKHVSYLTELVQHCQNTGQLTTQLSAPGVARLLLDAAHGGILRDAVNTNLAGVKPTNSVLAALEALS